MPTKDISDRQVFEAFAEYQANRPEFTLDEVVRRITYGGATEQNSPWPYEILQRMTGQPEKVCYRAMERAHDRDLIECGVSLRAGWLTDKGKRLLAEP